MRQSDRPTTFATGEDFHVSHTMRKYANIGSYVMPYNANDDETKGSKYRGLSYVNAATSDKYAPPPKKKNSPARCAKHVYLYSRRMLPFLELWALSRPVYIRAWFGKPVVCTTWSSFEKMVDSAHKIMISDFSDTFLRNFPGGWG